MFVLPGSVVENSQVLDAVATAMKAFDWIAAATNSEPLEEGLADRKPLEEDSAGGDALNDGREPLDNDGCWLNKAGAEGEAFNKVGAGVEPRFLIWLL